MAWTNERIETLQRMWAEGFTASEIAEELGGVSRNAVIGKAHRVGLRSRPAKDDGDWSIADPIREVAGSSTVLSALLKWRWPSGGKRYVDRNVSRVLELASKIAQRDDDGPVTITVVDLVEATLGIGLDPKSSSLAGAAGSYLAAAGYAQSDRARRALQDAAKPGDAILRWDVVAILVECAHIRERTTVGTGPTDFITLIAALISSPVAANALREALPTASSGVTFKEAALRILADHRLRRGEPAAWDAEIARIANIPALLPQRRAGYASDKVVAGGDVFGTATDARALADLIMLQAAAPPLAIGIFGAWGSGKSTLIAELKSEISRQVNLEQQRVAAGIVATDELAKVSGVMQLEFNAWTFADSENLWASLTAELFDQIAAGGSDRAGAAVGSRLVAEVATRTGREASELTLAKMQLEDSEGSIAAAKKALRAAEQETRSTIFTSLFDSLSDMLRSEKPVTERDGNVSTAGTADAAGKDAKPEGGKVIDAPSPALKAVREALLIDQGQSGEEIARGYADAGSSMVRFLLFAKAWLWSQVGRRAVIFAAVVTVLCALLWWLRVSILPPAHPLTQRVSSTFLLLAPSVFAFWSVVLPILRGAGIMRKNFVAAQKRSEEVIRAARNQLIESQKAKIEAQATVDRSGPLVERFGLVNDLGSPPPELMLDYLLKDSADVTALRGRLGTLGTVRRCFEQLNNIVERMQVQNPNNQVQRIIIYIDDLDRCSERQVVQILEAIHLLLAFPCFVVVTAVDARWLRDSLISQHQALSQTAGGIDPADYLEKIFQIPFWVRPMSGSQSAGASAYSAYLRALLRAPPEETADSDFSDSAETNYGPQRDFPQLDPRRPSADDLEVGEDLQLRLTSQEFRLLDGMQPIAGRSPRAVKRMVNIYRLLRVSIPEHLVDDYLGPGQQVPPYWAVILILACETGLPSASMCQLAQRIKAIEEDDLDVIQSVALDIYDELSVEQALPEMTVAIDFVRSPEGRVCLQGIAVIASTGVSMALGPLRSALDLVDRYSFRAD